MSTPHSKTSSPSPFGSSTSAPGWSVSNDPRILSSQTPTKLSPPGTSLGGSNSGIVGVVPVSLSQEGTPMNSVTSMGTASRVSDPSLYNPNLDDLSESRNPDSERYVELPSMNSISVNPERNRSQNQSPEIPKPQSDGTATPPATDDTPPMMAATPPATDDTPPMIAAEPAEPLEEEEVASGDVEGEADAANSSETAEAIAVRSEQRRMMEAKERDIQHLELTKEQLLEMLDKDQGLTTNEFFDMKFWKQTMNSCWADRTVVDDDTKEEIPRLWPNAASPLRRVGADDIKDGAPVDSDQFERRHPMMFRNVQRNRARRQLFNESMAHQNNSTIHRTSQSSLAPLPGLPQDHSATSVGNTTAGAGAVSLPSVGGPSQATTALLSDSALSSAMNDVRSRVMNAPPLTRPAGWKGTQSTTKLIGATGTLRKKKTSTEEESLTAPTEDTDKETTSPKKKEPLTLSELLAEQREQLAANDKKDVEVYRPLLASFVAYEEHAQQKLDRLARDGFGTNVKPSSPAGDTDTVEAADQTAEAAP